ncbi:MAG: helix-turn-helix domain-containing protein [Acetobacteraceae bacterium]
MAAIREAAAAHGILPVARKAGLSRQHLNDALSGAKVPRKATLSKLARVAHSLAATRLRAVDVLPAVRQRCQEVDRRSVARLAGINNGHLGRILAGTRRPSAATLAKLACALPTSPTPTAGAQTTMAGLDEPKLGLGSSRAGRLK